VTAFALPEDEKGIRDAGCDAYIAKPISGPNFLKIVEEFLG
jgi:two-component system, cell cycle response regulator DivK